MEYFGGQKALLEQCVRDAAGPAGMPEAHDAILSSAQRLSFWRPSRSAHIPLIIPPAALLYSRVAYQVPFSIVDVSTAL